MVMGFDLRVLGTVEAGLGVIGSVGDSSSHNEAASSESSLNGFKVIVSHCEICNKKLIIV